MAAATKERTIWRNWTATPRLLRFFAVGGINTAFGYAAYAAFLFVGFHYAWAAFLGTIVGAAFNFFTTGRLVFESMSNEGMVRFFAVYGAVYLLNIGCLASLQAADIGPYLGGLILIVPMALVSFALMRRFVFRSDRGSR